ncbi:DUF4344 domain-containing metallopeptidase [Lysobacter capsici]|uniref:DUF4344 domain-containing metallopeptidase n=1 Tax=Lysobacter capsici TaxID=435897 RepID=UPI00287BB96A|nr:DUF4344 domain-containing metallopeptidase [Lysobacter capsici]WND80749.1 DUF4344 domain-containing metallopeptidase [Lysobacter capsici]WND85945.1 DUF4344 domain-containing metallopeptidase [Lysobacter capsici]
MVQKIIIGILAAALIAVCSIWGYSAWQAKQAAAPVVAPLATAAAVPVKPVEAITPPAEVVPVAAEVPAEKADGTHFTYEYVSPRNPDLLPMYNMAREIDVLKQLPEVNQLDGWLTLPRPIHYIAAECGTVNAFYAKDKGDIVLCYEMLEFLVRQGAAMTQANGGSTRDQLNYLMANLRFLMLHETGHALVDMLDLPSTGREEDAVDQLATTLMLSFVSADESAGDIAQKLQLAATFFIATDDGQHDMATYADEHSVGAQRYFNLQCMVYGHNPGKYLRIVTSGRLPEARALRCEEESKQITRNWMRLIEPNIAPKHRMTAEEERAKIEEIQRKQVDNAQAPYMR